MQVDKLKLQALFTFDEKKKKTFLKNTIRRKKLAMFTKFSFFIIQYKYVVLFIVTFFKSFKEAFAVIYISLKWLFILLFMEAICYCKLEKKKS